MKSEREGNGESINIICTTNTYIYTYVVVSRVKISLSTRRKVLGYDKRSSSPSSYYFILVTARTIHPKIRKVNLFFSR